MRIGEPSPAERLDRACARLRPSRISSICRLALSLFGLTRLPASYLDVLQALAGVGTCISSCSTLRPSCGLGSPRSRDDRPPIVHRAEDATAALPENPLLGLLGPRRARDATRPRRAARRRRHTRPRHRRGAAGDAARANPGRRPCRSIAAGAAPPRRADRRRSRARTIAACRCTDVTVAPVRSR